MKLDLSNVTAICIDGRPVEEARQANYQTILKYMLSCVTFGKIKMISLEDPKVAGVDFIQAQLMTIQDYSHFCINKLHSYVDTDFCLVFQDDGFILNPELWSADFLKYDYIGAPWPLYIGWPTVGSQVGNGGFSLRSKRLLEFTKNIRPQFVAPPNKKGNIYVQRNMISLQEAGIGMFPEYSEEEIQILFPEKIST